MDQIKINSLRVKGYLGKVYDVRDFMRHLSTCFEMKYSIKEYLLPKKSSIHELVCRFATYVEERISKAYQDLLLNTFIKEVIGGTAQFKAFIEITSISRNYSFRYKKNKTERTIVCSSRTAAVLILNRELGEGWTIGKTTIDTSTATPSIWVKKHSKK